MNFVQLAALDGIAEFEGQAQFDTITWGRRHVATSRGAPPIKIELFETFDDDFVRSEFSRRSHRFVSMLGRSIDLAAHRGGYGGAETPLGQA